MRTSIFGAGLQGRSAVVTSQHRINFFAELRPEDDKTRIAYYGTPGLDLFVDFGDTPARGEIEVGSLLYVVHRGIFYEVNNAGVKTSMGTLNTTSGRVDMRYNGTQVLVVDGTNGYTYTVATTTFAVISDVDYLDAASTCAWQDGYFLVANGREFAVSSIDDGTAWDATERADAEANPDEILRIIEITGQVLLMGPKTIERWANIGALDFPYQRMGGGVIDWGLAAKWSAIEFEGTIAGLFQNKEGGVVIGVLAGSSIKPFSTPDVEALINDYTTKSDATALAYRHSGHAFLQMNFPSEGKSWIYDLSSGVWSELQSSGGRHRAEIGTTYLNKIMVSDYENGKLYRLNPNTYTENGTMMVSEIVSKHIYNETPFSIGSIWVDMEEGVGATTGQGVDPQIMLSVSKDGGRTYGNELWRSFGKLGKYVRARWNRLGRSREFVFKLKISDPVKRVIIGDGWLS